jgi:TIR domain-containing protein
MASVYVSYKSEDRPIVDELVARLEARGHQVVFDRMLYVGAAWREQLMSMLLAADAVLLVWTKNTHRSQYVAAEVGAVRATPGVALLPVIVESSDIPPFIQDIFASHLDDLRDDSYDKLADDLERALALHIDQRTRHKAGQPKVFVSHRHRDEDIVRALVSCLQLNFEVNRSDVRCTSVAPYRLPVGDDTGDRLRKEISGAEVVLGVLTTDTLRSSYVAFELGSAWGQLVWTCPLLARGADESHIPDPIRSLAPLFLTKSGDCRQLLDDLADMTSLRRRGATQAELDAAVAHLVAVASAPSPRPGDNG